MSYENEFSWYQKEKFPLVTYYAHYDYGNKTNREESLKHMPFALCI